MAQDGYVAEQKLVFALRSPEALQLAELAGYNADLGETSTSLTIAGAYAVSQDRIERNLVRPLVTDATVAYGRSFTTSNLRKGRNLGHIIEIPDHLKATHEAFMRLRNSTVAHSESRVTPSYAVVHLERDDDGASVRGTAVSAMTVHPAYSIEAIEAFHALVSAVKKLVLLELENAKAALYAGIDADHLTKLWHEGGHADFETVSFDEWNIKRRPKYPTSRTIRVLVEPARTFLSPSTGNLFATPADESEG